MRNRWLEPTLSAEASDDVWLRALDVNLTASLRIVRGLETTLRAAEHGAIVNISSQISPQTAITATAYCVRCPPLGRALSRISSTCSRAS
ncbi:SDR family NAD(P)-dependent oxidoreductase [Cryobacterium sp. Hh7]|uniref:SDR family NAD(P)-dependent oxidoreductase n=1 Tax=Cryobacterium sp. Hh7 TaxID=1259159 RepID=UPI003519FC20